MKADERVAVLAILVNCILFVLKYTVSNFSGSIALKAEAFHTFADCIASLTVFMGLKLAKKKSRLFPYGLYKIENVFSVIIALIIFYTGYEIFLEIKGMTIVSIEHADIAIASLLFSMIVTFLFSRYEKKIGEEIHLPMLLADAAHIHIDVLSNFIVLISIVFSQWGYSLEQVTAFFVVLFIVKTGWNILIDGLGVLLDASIDYETLSKVERIIIKTPEVVKVETLIGRNSGPFKFIEASIVLKAHDLETAHFIVDQIELNIRKKIKNIDRVFIHYEPEKKEKIIYAVPLEKNKKIIGEHFGEAPYFLLITFKNGEQEASKIEIVENPYSLTEKSKGILTAEFLIGKMIDGILIKKDFENRGPAYVFSDAGIKVILTEEKIPGAALKKINLSL